MLQAGVSHNDMHSGNIGCIRGRWVLIGIALAKAVAVLKESEARSKVVVLPEWS